MGDDVRSARGRRRATALAVAVVGGLLGGGQGTALAQPAAPGATPGTTNRATTTAPASTTAPPSVWPRPQSMKARGAALPLGGELTVVADPDADPYAVDLAHQVLRDAGARTTPARTAPPGGRGPVLHLGGAGAQLALRALAPGASAPGELPAGGYRLASGRLDGRVSIAVDGVDAAGLFHGVQTLRQLVDRGAIAEVVVHDWPGTAVRGTAEGFYGEPWTHQERLAQLDFMGRTKQNRYLYAPGDDPFRQARWRDAYPAKARAEFRELAERARRNHVTLAWAVAPAQEMCLADDGDVRALTRKIDAMWALGVRAFQLQFQDVSYSEWHCGRDADAFGRGPGAAARAHARLADAVARHLAERHPGAEPLSLMPTEFYQDGDTAYRRALAAELDGRVQVAWTGVGVVPRTITGGDVAKARAAFRHPLVTMDNYPVNDYDQDRLFLGPYTGRDPAVAAGSAALLANAMEQASASRIPLFTAADYAWNPKGYRPQESWRAALDDLAGGDPAARDALGAVAGHHTSSVLSGAESDHLRPLIDAFWRTRAGTNKVRDDAAAALKAQFTAARQAPGKLTGPADGRLDDEMRPWLDQLARYGRAGELAVELLQAQARGDGAAAWAASLALEPVRRELAASPAVVGKGVLGPFVDRAVQEAAQWTGAARVAEGQDATGVVDLGRVRPLDAVTVMTAAKAAGAPTGRLEARAPGEGWRAVAELSPTGWTQVPTKSLRADALRVVGATGVRAVVPWFADVPAVGLDLPRKPTDAEIGGAAQRVDVRLTPQRPADARGPLTAKAPPGVDVKLPDEAAVARGRATTVPVEVTVAPDAPAGTYLVPLSFAGGQQTLTVRAFPRTGGPDLLRLPGTTASSSGDETPDFPASAALDGDAGSRWSSPYEDGAWWQVELAAPVRLGQVVVHWQDAYAARYRVQVSSDGRTWRDAATVTAGAGGRESVRMDAPDVRFVRVQGDERATRFGYSFFAVEAYAVAP
ncbi:beta-N-acetylglucosaminidase domain-containing protein [Streptomyces sp. NPDC047315]|uniref:beta-N-acetylglucosaminidase domain-containing protein n=1 Tax=Streptomyces sp. NPDC047315 TaxID=3155142 RepID=UPI0033F28D60